MTDTTITARGQRQLLGRRAAPERWSSSCSIRAASDPIDLFEAGQLDYTPIDHLRRGVGPLRPRSGPASCAKRPTLTLQYYGFDTTHCPLQRQSGPARLSPRRSTGTASSRWATATRRTRWCRRACPTSTAPTTGRPTTRPAPAICSAGGLRWRRRLPASLRCVDRLWLRSRGGGRARAASWASRSTSSSTTSAICSACSRAASTPKFWNQVWSADYPHPHDYLGLLLETGSASNDGGWSNAAYDAEIAAAAAAADADRPDSSTTPRPRRSCATRRRSCRSRRSGAGH